MDDNELQKFCIKFNNLIWKNSKQGDKRISKFVNKEGNLDSMEIIIDKHLKKQNGIKFKKILHNNKMCEEPKTNDELD